MHWTMDQNENQKFLINVSIYNILLNKTCSFMSMILNDFTVYIEC